MSSTIDDGGNAFPTIAPKMTQHGHMSSGAETVGMSLRDYFAGQTIASALSAGDYDLETANFEGLAAYAYQIADAMIAARKVKS